MVSHHYHGRLAWARSLEVRSTVDDLQVLTGSNPLLRYCFDCLRHSSFETRSVIVCEWGQRRRADGYAAKNKGRYLLYPTLATIAPQPCYLSIVQLGLKRSSLLALARLARQECDQKATKKRPKSDRKSDLDITVTSSCTTFGGLGILFFGLGLVSRSILSAASW